MDLKKKLKRRTKKIRVPLSLLTPSESINAQHFDSIKANKFILIINYRANKFK